IGSEWVTGTSIVSELWPDKNRGKGVGLMQCGFGIGFFLASLAWLFISPIGPDDLARHAPARRCAGAADAVDQASDPRIRQMGARERASRRRNRTQAQRRGAQRAGGVACSFHYA